MVHVVYIFFMIPWTASVSDMGRIIPWSYHVFWNNSSETEAVTLGTNSFSLSIITGKRVRVPKVSTDAGIKASVEEGTLRLSLLTLSQQMFPEG